MILGELILTQNFLWQILQSLNCILHEPVVLGPLGDDNLELMAFLVFSLWVRKRLLNLAEQDLVQNLPVDPTLGVNSIEHNWHFIHYLVSRGSKVRILVSRPKGEQKCSPFALTRILGMLCECHGHLHIHGFSPNSNVLPGGHRGQCPDRTIQLCFQGLQPKSAVKEYRQSRMAARALRCRR